MKTRIRYHRKLRRLTQTDLARLVGTTAATISRLETADMNVSMNWLQRFADIFHVPVADLIEETRAPGRIPCIGEIGRTGALSESREGDEDDVALEAHARNPIAIRVRENFGPYCVGDIIIADRMSSDDVPHALDRDCFVDIEGEEAGFGRFVSSDNGAYLLVPPEPGAQARSLAILNWIAPVVMLIRYL